MPSFVDAKADGRLIGVGLLVMAFLVQGCDFGETSRMAKGPRLCFASDRHDFGTVRESVGKVTWSFPFRNEGKDPLLIHRVSSSCGCVKGSLSPERPIGPGERGTVEVAFDLHLLKGQARHTLFVTSNDPLAPSQQLEVAAYIKARLFFEPPFLEMGPIVLGQSKTMTVSLFTTDGELAVDTPVVENFPLSVHVLRAEEVAGEEDKLVRIPLEISAKATGRLGRMEQDIQIRLSHTDGTSTEVPSLRYAVMVEVVPQIGSIPPFFEVATYRPATPFVSTVMLRSRSGFSFKVLEVSTEGDAAMRLSASCETVDRSAQSSHEIHVSGVTPSESGPIRAEVIIVTDHEEDGIITIPINGFVRRPTVVQGTSG